MLSDFPGVFLPQLNDLTLDDVEANASDLQWYIFCHT